ncbi:Copper-exporting P-type ATPase [compost metagenome]
MAKCDTLVFDKTGTLTSTANAQIRFEGVLSPDEEKMAASLLKHSSHPLSRHILKSIRYHGFYEISDFKEMPGKGITGTVANRQVRLGAAQILSAFSGNSGRQGVHLQIGAEYKGCFVVDQEWREGLPQLMARLEHRFDLSVLSGDTPKDEAFLRRLFPKETEMRFGQRPAQKLNVIFEKQKSGARVRMLGDGLNDAGALKQSDFGIAITDNVNNFTPGCDAILKGSSLPYLPDFCQLSKDGLKIIKSSFVIAAAYNCIGLYYAVQGTLYPLVAAILMPVSTITIISFTTLATRYYAKKNKLQ